MKLIQLNILSLLFAFSHASTYNFNVVSILGEGYSLGVKFNNKIVHLESTVFPLFTGTVEDNSINQYKYVAFNKNNKVIEEETIVRNYNDETPLINEVYNRQNKKVDLPTLPTPLNPQFKLGTENYQPIPDNVIYNIYAKCDETNYKIVTADPFTEDDDGKDIVISCNFNIISPDSVFQSAGNMHTIGYGSRLYKKLSWNIKFSDKNKFLGRKSFKLRGIANDKSLIREKLTSKVYKSAGVPVQEGAYARLFINGDTYGLYLISDSFNKNWMGAYIHGDKKAKVGFTYKLVSTTPKGPYASLKYLGENYKSYKKSGTYILDEYEKDEVDPNDKAAPWARLIEFTRLYDAWVTTYQNDTSDKAIEELKKFLNIESVLRVMAVDTLVIPLDNFWLIMSNSALYYNPERGNYQIIPFDFDETMRGSWDEQYFNPNNYIKDCITWPNYNESLYEHYFTNHLLEHPQIRKRYDIILAELSHKTYDSDIIYNYINAIASLIREDVQWNIDAVNNLNIPYNGKVQSFTMNHFEKNLKISVKPTSSVKDSYDLRDFVNLRGGFCRDYTSNIDTSDNSNISDDLKLEMSEIIPTPVTSSEEDQQIFNFNVVSLFGKRYSLGVKYDEEIVSLNSTAFPLYSGSIKAKNINKYKYVALNAKNEIVEEESFFRTYTNETIVNEVYNRVNKSVSRTEIPDPLEPIFPMGTEKYQPIPDNVIYNVYAKCDEVGYANVTTNPFFNGREIRNEMKVPCSITIISPDSVFQSEGTVRLIGFGSRLYKKLSWSIQFTDKKFFGRKTVKMRGMAGDRSLMREKLATELYKSAGVPVQEGAYARFFINDDIYGLYLITDTLNKKWLGAYVHGDEKAKIGMSYKLLSTVPDGPYCDLKYMGTRYSKYKNKGIYEVDEYEKEDVDPNDESTQWNRLIEFTKLFDNWVNTYKNDSSDKAVKELEKFLNLEPLLRLMAIDTLILPLDNFWLIMSNVELYYNPVDNKYLILPFDFDQSLYGSWDISSLNPDNYIEDCITWANYNESINDHYFLNNIMKHPQIKKRYDIILDKISNQSFDPVTVNNYLLSIVELIKDDVQWNIDSVKSLNIPYQGEVKNMKLSHFNRSYNIKYNDNSKNGISDSYELQEFVNVRGEYCRAYTSTVDLKEDENEEKNKDNEGNKDNEENKDNEGNKDNEENKDNEGNKDNEENKENEQNKENEENNTSGFKFNVVSILGKDYSMGVKYGNNIVVPLNISTYPLYTGTIEDENLSQYKYVALNSKNKVVKEEIITRTYNDEIINEVFNRTNKYDSIPELSSPLESLFPMGSEKYQPIPDNVVYTVYAKCEEVSYTNVTTNPFFNGRSIENNKKVPCTFNIISPDSTFQSEGTMNLIGYGARKYKKLSWGIHFTENEFFGREYVEMNGIAKDKSLMREKLASKLYSSVGVPVQENAYARLIINDDIYGLYLISDVLNKKWIGAYIHGDENANIGTSYSLNSDTPDGPYCDLKYLGDSYSKYAKSNTYEINEFDDDENDDDEATKWSSLIRFTKLFDQWVKTYEKDTSSKAIRELETFLNLESVLRLMVIDTLILPLDNFWLIMSNTDLYYNPEDKTYHFIPYDFDESLVGSWEISSLDPSNYIKDCITWANYDESINDHYFINNLMKHPQIKERYNTILEQVTQNTYQTYNVYNYISGIADLIREDVEWNINAVDNLAIPYSGKVTSFKMKHFNRNCDINYGDDNDEVSDSYELLEFVRVRGNYCRAYVDKLN